VHNKNEDFYANVGAVESRHIRWLPVASAWLCMLAAPFAILLNFAMPA